jgi:hypothetical protein
VDALLGDRPVRIRVVAGDGGDQMSSVGLPDTCVGRSLLNAGSTARPPLTCVLTEHTITQ